jgi:hypothetical protein
MHAVAMGVKEPPGLIVEGRGRPARGFEQGQKVLMGDRLARHGTRRPAAVEKIEDRMIDLTFGHRSPVPESRAMNGPDSARSHAVKKANA